MKTKTINVNIEKLKNWFTDTKLNPAEVGIIAGYSRKWLLNALRTGVMTLPMVKVLEPYGFKLEDVQDLPQIEENVIEVLPETVNNPRLCNMTQKQLYETIFHAVVDALCADANSVMEVN